MSAVTAKQKPRTATPGPDQPLDIPNVDGYAEMLKALGNGKNGLYRYLTDLDFHNAERDRLSPELEPWNVVGSPEDVDLATAVEKSLSEADEMSANWAASEKALAALEDRQFVAWLKAWMRTREPAPVSDGN